VSLEEKMAELTRKRYKQFKDAHRPEAEIKKNLSVLGVGD